MVAGKQGERTGFAESELFPTTLWGDIHAARGRSQPALARLCERYRDPLFIYLQRRGLDYHAASDLVQGFFAHLLEREFLVGLEPGKGRFRAFLVQSLQNFLCDQADRASARKRGGRVTHLPLTGDPSGLAGETLRADASLEPDQAYEQAWARAVLKNAIASWRKELASQGDGVPLAEVVERLMYADADAPSFGELALVWGVGVGALKMRAYRSRLRLAYWIREEIRRTLARGEAVDDELRHLILVLRTK
jgi:DNA-directed RNA polymerase specialized sigma24 family protein